MNEFGNTIDIRLSMISPHLAFMYIFSVFSKQAIKLYAKRLFKFSTILSTNSSKLMQLSAPKFLLKAM